MANAKHLVERMIEDLPTLDPEKADAVQQVGTNRFLPATAIVMHTRRWGWITAALDSSNRPLVVPTQNGPYMAEGVLTDVQAQGGPVGSMHGLPVYLDPNIPTTLGGGTEDAIKGAERMSAGTSSRGWGRARPRLSAPNRCQPR